MAFVLADRVRETSTTEGTGTYTLLGNVAGFRTFASGIGGANVCTYVATMGSQWEVGIGTVSGSTLSRGTILASSNAGSAVNWTAGTKDMRCDLVATHITQMYRGAVRWGGTSGGTANAQTITLSPAITEYWDGLTIIFTAGATNSGDMTIDVNSIGPVTLRKFTNVTMAASEITAAVHYLIVYVSGGSFPGFRLLSTPV